MATTFKRISDLAAGAAPAAGDLLDLAQGGNSVKITVGQLADGMGSAGLVPRLGSASAVAGQRLEFDGANWVPVTPSVTDAALVLPTRTITSAYTLTASDCTARVDATAAPIAVTLPACATVAGQVFNVKKIDGTGNSVIITAQAGETIDGGAVAQILAQWASVTVQSNGTSWDII